MAEHRSDKKDGWQRYDWTPIEVLYVTSPSHIGLRRIAKKIGCNIKSVERHSKKNQWFRKRKEYGQLVNMGQTTVFHERIEGIRDVYRDEPEAFGRIMIGFSMSVMDQIAKLMHETPPNLDMVRVMLERFFDINTSDSDEYEIGA